MVLLSGVSLKHPIKILGLNITNLVYQVNLQLISQQDLHTTTYGYVCPMQFQRPTGILLNVSRYLKCESMCGEEEGGTA